jgi:chloramphenicol-sensitive protein RarD
VSGSRQLTTSSSAEAAGREPRLGTLAGIAAFTLWGSFPLVFHQLMDVSPLEVLAHRVLWSFVFVAGLLVWRRDGRWLDLLRRRSVDRTRLAAAAVLISINWLVYVWAVSEANVVEAALGYYVNPLITVALGVVVLGEHLRRLQVAAVGCAAVAVVVLTVAYGRVPWIALTLACSFAGYGYLKKSIPVTATTSLAVETAVLAPVALAGVVVAQVRGTAAFGHGSAGQTALLIALGVITAVPLLLFATAARRIPLSLLGLLQYLTPTLQLLVAVFVLDEDFPPERFVGFALVWLALALLAVDAVRAGGLARRTRVEVAAAG